MTVSAKVYAKALALKKDCEDAMDECKKDPETYGDPGDAAVFVGGRDMNVLDVLHVLRAIGVST